MLSKRAHVHDRFGGQCKRGDIAPYVFVPGDPKRVAKLAAFWSDTRDVAHHYEFHITTGYLDAIPMTACSTGIGGRSVAIAVDELAALGATTFIRVGITGPIQEGVELGDLIISSGAVRMDKTSESYIDIRYPAAADFEVTAALIAAAERLGYRYHLGIVATTASFHCGEGRRAFGGYTQSFIEKIRDDLKAARVYDFDTETATLFTLASLYGLRAGRVNTSVVDPRKNVHDPRGETKAIRTALEAMRILAHWDAIKRESGVRFMLPCSITSRGCDQIER